MDEDRLELRWGLGILAAGTAGFAATFLRPWSPEAAWAVPVLLAAATLIALRRCDFARESTGLRLRLSFACVFGFVAAQAAYPDSKWSWDLPLITVLAAFLVALSVFPSRDQKGRAARALPLSAEDRAALPAVGSGYKWAYWLFQGILISLALLALAGRGGACALALLFALCVPLVRLADLAKRRGPPGDKTPDLPFPGGRA